MRNRSLFYTIVILSGVVIGTLVGNLTSGISALSWLSYGLVFGMAEPVRLELGVLSLTFGISINLTIACILCILLAVLIGRKVMHKR